MGIEARRARMGVGIAVMAAERTNDNMTIFGLERWQDRMKVLEARIHKLETHFSEAGEL